MNGSTRRASSRFVLSSLLFGSAFFFDFML